MPYKPASIFFFLIFKLRAILKNNFNFFIVLRKSSVVLNIKKKKKKNQFENNGGHVCPSILANSISYLYIPSLLGIAQIFCDKI